MKTTYFKLVITETGRNCPKDKPEIFNEIIEKFLTIGQLKVYLIERYGRMPGGRKKIYRDVNGKSTPCGFIHSFWNQDMSHMSELWFQTDWIEICEVKEDINWFKLAS